MSCEVPFGSSLRTPTPLRNPTVDDMIEWLRWEEWYRGRAGWSAEYIHEEIFRLDEDHPDANGFAAVHGSGSWRCPKSIEFQINAMLPEQSYLEEHRRYVRSMIQAHKSLVSEAEVEVDHRIVQAGFSVEDYESGREWPSSLYAKLQQLEKIKRRDRCDSQIRVKVVCHPGIRSSEYFPLILDLYIPKTCDLVEFEGCLKEYAIIQGTAKA
jgi:hypothetical protein